MEGFFNYLLGIVSLPFRLSLNEITGEGDRSRINLTAQPAGVGGQEGGWGWGAGSKLVGADVAFHPPPPGEAGRGSVGAWLAHCNTELNGPDPDTETGPVLAASRKPQVRLPSTVLLLLTCWTEKLRTTHHLARKPKASFLSADHQLHKPTPPPLEAVHCHQGTKQTSLTWAASR